MGPAYNALQWTAYFSAQVGASAALTGLIFVAVSINLPNIIAEAKLVSRSAKAILTLTGVLLESSFCLVPAQSGMALGLELTVLGGVVWVLTTLLQIRSSHKNPYVSRGQKILLGILTQVSGIPVWVAGISLIVGAGGGLYWLLGATVACFLSALIDAWVLLIEIQR